MRVVATLGAAVVMYLVAASSFRHLEALASAGLLRGLGLGEVHAFSRDIIGVFPRDQTGFLIKITPSCSALASLLSIGLLSTLLPVPDPRRWARALTLALLMVLVGNLVRISASIAVGYVSGRLSLVLFHDWVGSVFGFAYTLLGFMVLLRLMLPRRTVRLPAPRSS